jgi:hypothetical protein
LLLLLLLRMASKHRFTQTLVKCVSCLLHGRGQIDKAFVALKLDCFDVLRFAAIHCG